MTIDHKNNKVHHDILEVDDHGITPGMPGFNAKCVSCIQLVSKGNLEVWNSIGHMLYVRCIGQHYTKCVFIMLVIVSSLL